MADLQFTISEEKIQAMLFGERGMEVLTEELFNQLLTDLVRLGVGDVDLV
jgi:hypothetical protein